MSACIRPSFVLRGSPSMSCDQPLLGVPECCTQAGCPRRRLHQREAGPAGTVQEPRLRRLLATNLTKRSQRRSDIRDSHAGATAALNFLLSLLGYQTRRRARSSILQVRSTFLIALRIHREKWNRLGLVGSRSKERSTFVAARGDASPVASPQPLAIDEGGHDGHKEANIP